MDGSGQREIIRGGNRETGGKRAEEVRRVENCNIKLLVLVYDFPDRFFRERFRTGVCDEGTRCQCLFISCWIPILAV